MRSYYKKVIRSYLGVKSGCLFGIEAASDQGVLFGPSPPDPDDGPTRGSGTEYERKYSLDGPLE